jgi:hypothetical protein
METSMEASRELKIEPSHNPVTLYILNASHLVSLTNTAFVSAWQWPVVAMA